MNEQAAPRTLSDHELRGETAAILDAVEAGESLIIARDGVPIGQLTPIKRRRLIPTEELRRTFGTSPAPDYSLMRAEMDAYFGEDRIGDGEQG